MKLICRKLEDRLARGINLRAHDVQSAPSCPDCPTVLDDDACKLPVPKREANAIADL